MNTSAQTTLSKPSFGVYRYVLLWTSYFLLAVPVACLYTGESLGETFDGFYRILTSPCRLITDYFAVGGLSATLWNTFLCGAVCCAMIYIFKPAENGTLLGGYFLVIAHCFFGLNFLNMWLPMIGIFVYCLVCKERIGDRLPLAMYATSLGPFISDFLFRYTLGDAFVQGEVQVSVGGVLLAVGFSLGAGFLIPGLLRGTTQMHRGYNLYKAGLAIGLFGVLMYSLLYKTMGVSSPEVLSFDNPDYEAVGGAYNVFMDVFYLGIFLVTLLLGYFYNGKTFRGYKRLLRFDGWQDDFTEKCGMPVTLINIGVYGFFVLVFFNAAILLTDVLQMPGVGFTGPTAGVVIAAVTFSGAGQHPKNVWPIPVGYLCLTLAVFAVCRLANLPIVYSMTVQPAFNGLAFATGLCPFTSRYGRRYGVIAGMLSAALCTSTAAMHGGLVLYNSGFTAGLSAMLLLPVLEFYKVPVIEVNEE